jgi:hypothetical protein
MERQIPSRKLLQPIREPALRHAIPQLHSRLRIWQEGRNGLYFWRAGLRRLAIPVWTYLPRAW